jgi:hypothetical protein
VNRLERKDQRSSYEIYKLFRNANECEVEEFILRITFLASIDFKAAFKAQLTDVI